MSVTLKPLSSLSISTGPALNRSRSLTSTSKTEVDPVAVPYVRQPLRPSERSTRNS